MKIAKLANISGHASPTSRRIVAARAAENANFNPTQRAPAKKPAAPVKNQPEAQSGWHPSILNICGYALIVVGAGGLGTGYYFDTVASKDLSAAQKKYDDYKNATSDTDTKWNDYQNQLNIAKQDVQYRNIFYIAGGVTLGAGIIMAFIPNNPKKTASIYITPDSINVALRF